MISVCLASYNGGDYIKEQITSILDQLSSGDELIITDDGSNDETLTEIDSFNDPRIQLISNNEKLGVIKNFERALKASKGDYIFLCDQDDVWLPGKVAQFMAKLESNILVVSDCKVVDANLQEISPSFFKLRGSRPGLFYNIIKNGYLGCCMAFNRELLDYALPLPKGAAMHDIWLGLIAETRGQVCFLEKTLILFRRHESNASPTARKSNLSIYTKIRNRITLVSLLLIRVTRNIFLNKTTL